MVRYFLKKVNHRDTENTEVAQRRSSFRDYSGEAGLSEIRSLWKRVAARKFNSPAKYLATPSSDRPKTLTDLSGTGGAQLSPTGFSGRWIYENIVSD